MDGKVSYHANSCSDPNIRLQQSQVGVKTIARTFASGKTEKLVYQVFAHHCILNHHFEKEKKILSPDSNGNLKGMLMQTLADCGLPNGKGDSIEHSAFTFEVLFHNSK